MAKEKLPFKITMARFTNPQSFEEIKKGCLEPAGSWVSERLREKKYRLGDIVFAELTKPRNPKFNKLVHAFGRLVAENIESFEGTPSHDVLKRLQIEANIACKEIALNFPGVGPCSYRVAESLSFESMEEGRFNEVYSQFCKYIIKKYWYSMKEEEIKRLAEIMENE